MADITLPNGTVVTGVRDGTTQEQVIQALVAKNQTDPSFLKVAGREGLASFVDNLMGVPDLMAQAGATAVNDLFRPVRRAGEAAAAVVSGDFGQFTQDPRFAPNTGDIAPNAPFQRGRTPPPGANPLNTIQTPAQGQNFVAPTSNDIFGGAQVLGENLAQQVTGSEVPPATLEQAQGQQQAITNVGRRESPGAALTGDILGDAAMLSTLRGSVRSGKGTVASQRALSQLDDVVRNTAIKNAQATFSNPATANTAKEFFTKTFEGSTGLRTLLNRAGRAGEAGLEGAVIALLNEGDPIEVAAYSAGTQAGSSLLLSGVSGIFSGGPTAIGLKLAASSAAIGAVFQIMQSATPGGDDSPIASLESGFNKVMAGILLGTISGIGGGGRITSKFPVKALPGIADAITSLPRGAVLSTINEMLKDPSAEVVLNQLRTDPSFFGNTARRQIERALSVENVSLLDTLESLKSNREFREAFEGLK